MDGKEGEYEGKVIIFGPSEDENFRLTAHIEIAQTPRSPAEEEAWDNLTWEDLLDCLRINRKARFNKFGEPRERAEALSVLEGLRSLQTLVGDVDRPLHGNVPEWYL